MRRFTLFTIAIAIAVTAVVSTGTGQVQAQPPVDDTSHLKLTSSASHSGTHVDQVINNDINVKITVHDALTNKTDWGILNLRPGSTPNAIWTCTSCANGLFYAVVACDQAGGCSPGDVEYWLVGVKTAIINPGPYSYVHYDIDSDDLGDGKRHHASPADCNTTVTPKGDTYDAWDWAPGWDYATYCTDNGVSINLDYE